jgi:hypothetical protein
LPDGKNDCRRADFEALSALTDIQRLQERGGTIAVGGEMVLGNQAVVKADDF